MDFIGFHWFLMDFNGLLAGVGAFGHPSQDRCESIRDSIDASSSEYEKDKMKERLAKLSGGVAVIKAPVQRPTHSDA